MPPVRPNFPDARRVSSWHRRPSPPRACELAKRCRDRGIPVTLVTPFLTNCGFRTTLELITRLLAVVETLEVVCSDWGLLYYLASRKLGTPVIGRLLAAQATDPRIMRMVDGRSAVERPRVIRHLDGTACQLRRRCPSTSLTRHYRGCWLDKPRVLSFLSSLGIGRCELNNPGQGIELASSPCWCYSLHVPDVIVSVLQQCPGPEEDFLHTTCCNTNSCMQAAVRWQCDGYPSDLFRRGNAIFYRWPHLPLNLTALPIDRIVHRVDYNR